MKIISVAACALATALLAACTPMPATPPAVAASISDSRWNMSEASFGIPEGVTPTLEFGAGRLTAHSGCNRAFGPYKDLGGRLEAGPLAATRMGCRDAINEFEIKYYRLLSLTPAYRFEGATLTLTADSGRVKFQRAPDAAK